MEVAIKSMKEKARRIYSEPKEGQTPLELQTFLEDIFESRFLLGEPIPLLFLPDYPRTQTLGNFIGALYDLRQEGYPFSFLVSIHCLPLPRFPSICNCV